MAQTDAAVILPGTGHVLVGASGVTIPTQAQLEAYVTSGTAITGLETIGHTSIDDLPTPDVDGGDITTLSTWQSTSFYTTVEATTDYVTVNALQVDGTVLPLFYGGGTVAAGQYDLPDAASAQDCSVCFIFVSGDVVVALFATKASAIRDGAPTVANDSFMSWPIRFTFVKSTGQPRASWIAASIAA